MECFCMQTEMPLAASPFSKPDSKQPDFVVDPTQFVPPGGAMSRERGFVETDADYYDF